MYSATRATVLTASATGSACGELRHTALRALSWALPLLALAAVLAWLHQV